jgi:hypothetical protein
VAALVVGLLASIGPAAQSVRDGIEFLWPVGVVGILAVLCLLLLWERWTIQTPSPPPTPARTPDARGASAPADSGTSREKREAAYDAVLSASEAYINAHRATSDFDDVENVYLPDLHEAENAVDLANQSFVAARQRVEQHGVKPVLDATIDIEDAINNRDYDEAALVRRGRLVPAVRKDMNRPTTAFF